MKIVTFLFTLLFCIYLQASPYFLAKQISLNDGLSNSFVKCIQDDHKGYIWIGTKIGLNRFDKKNIKQYFFDENNKYSLPNNSINFIAEDSLLNLWISTDGGLVQYNRDADNFTRILFEGKPLEVNTFLKVSDGVYFGGSRLYKYYYKTGNIKLLNFNQVEFNKDAFAGYISTIIPWKKDVLVLTTRWNGTWLYNLTTNTLSPFKYCNEKYIQAACIDSKHNLWLSPYSKGLLCYTPDGKLLKQYSLSNSNISSNIILDIKEIDNKLWMGTDGGGVSIFDLNNSIFTVLKRSPKTPNSLPVNSISCVFYDRNHNIWAGSIRGGLIGIKKAFVKTYSNANLGSSYGLSEKTVLSLYEDKDHSIWIGTDGGGLNQLTPGTETFKHILPTYGEKIVTITGYSANELLISLYGKGLYIFNKISYKTTPLEIIDNNNNNKINNLGLAINAYQFSDNQFLISADKLYIYNVKDRSFKIVTIDNENGKDAPINSLNLISTNDKGTYLAGPNNIFEFNHSTLTLHSVFSCDSRNHLNNVCVDKEFRFWMATAKGLECYDLRKNKHSVIQNKLFQEATSICLFQGMLWIGAKGLLFVYSIDKKKFIVLGEDDGVTPNEFIPYSSFVASSGDAYMGGVGGLSKIDNSIFFKANDSPKISLMEVLLNGMLVSNIRTGETISIPWNHSSIVIKSLVREQDLFFSQKLYRFKISGLNINDIESYDNALSLYSLPQGEYKILVSCNNREGAWSQPINILTIVVTPPWWKSKWFILLLFLVIVAATFLTYKNLIRRKENKLKWELKEHKQKVFEEKVRFLINLSHELRTPLLLIYAPLKRILDKNEVSYSVKEQITSIYKHVKQIKNMINMVLDVQRMESGESMLTITSQPLNNWLMDVAGDFRNEFQAKNIELIFHLDSAIDGVCFDKVKCEIVFSNFLMNALKFGHENTRVTISSQIIGDYVRISISDQGIGLDGVDVTKLFTRFYKGDYSTGGTGIGLSYSKTLIELHKGKVGASNNIGPGATFFFDLPLNVKENANTELTPSLNELLSSTETVPYFVENTDSFDTHIYSILIVEDDIELSGFLKKSFNEHFKKIYTALDGQHALQIVHEVHPDLIISDIFMPKMNGFELLKAIKGNVETNYIPVILNTSRIESESAELGYRLGADAYLPKPYDLDSMYIIICNLLKNREYIKSKYKEYGVSPIIKEKFSSNNDEFIINKLNKIISENLSNPKLNVIFIAENLNMSRSNCYDKLNPIIGMGINEYINKCRIDTAIQMLLNTNLSIADIALETGFNNQQYFSIIFKKITGFTPSKFCDDSHRSIQ